MIKKSIEWNITGADVLYEDEAIIVVNKPSGVPSQATLDPNRDHAYAAVSRYLHGGYVGLHHRLDAGTSGVLLMTKVQEANASVSEQFQKHTIKKTYTALSCGESPDGRIASGANFLMKAAIGECEKTKVQKFCVGGKKRKHAETQVQCEQLIRLRDGYFGQFACQPLTGRTHQIRVHLEALGMGIVGDGLYGSGLLRSLRSIDPGRMCLHASELEFEHPLTGEPMRVKAPLPGAMEKFVRKALLFEDRTH